MDKAILADIHFTDRAYHDSWPPEAALEELRALAESCGLAVLQSHTIARKIPSVRTFIGKGKVEWLHQLCHETGANLVVFGKDLSFRQQRNLETDLGVGVIDRTQLILDIFARRAHSLEGKVQVELAQLQYLLPRLAGQGSALSRLGGGIGTRGPGEKKLEVDRRKIRLRITKLSHELKEIGKHRQVMRSKRISHIMPTVALVGYTNAGKSTLLNRLTAAGTPSKDQLFTTLDPLARRLELPSGQLILLSDTVGFLHQLPHHLIDAFSATLEEVVQSYLLVQVVDASDPMLEIILNDVEEVLTFLKAQDKPRLLVMNKIDQVPLADLTRLYRLYPQAVFISGKTGQGVTTLLERFITVLSGLRKELTVWLPDTHQHWIGKIYEDGEVLSKEAKPGGLMLTVRVSQRLAGQLAKAGWVQTAA